MIRRPSVLCISGLDGTGAAGLAADIETLMALGAHAMPVLTTIALQDTTDVRELRPLPGADIDAQARVVTDDIVPDAIKVGLLGGAGQATAVRALAARFEGVPLVLDTVLSSGAGRALASDAALAELVATLPVATVVTPNAPEAQALTGAAQPSPTGADAPALARGLLARGCRNACITGGHGLGGTQVPSDRLGIYLCGEDVAPETLLVERVPGSYRGTGCTFSSALAGRLAFGDDLRSAVLAAATFVARAARRAHRPGRGRSLLVREPAT